MVIALDRNKRPLGFMGERRCRILLERKRAVLYRYFPTIVILKDVDARKLSGLSSYRIKIDPGAKYTGIAIVRDDTNEFMYAMQIEHRGEQIKKNLDTRRNARGDRRSWRPDTAGRNGGISVRQKNSVNPMTAGGMRTGCRQVSKAPLTTSFPG